MAAFLAAAYTQALSPMDIEIWIEPFAGGAGAGLALLDMDRVDEVWLVEKNEALAAMWATIVADGERLASQVANTQPDMALWHASRELVAAAAAGRATPDRYDLGFAAFIINRCSRSGIVTPAAGPIGGKHQTGRWLVDSRFNGPELAERIRHIHGFARKGRLKTDHGDAIERIESLNDSGIGDEVFVFVDPPYIREGNRLYAHGMTAADHRRLADALNDCRSPWMLTYDDEPVVYEDLYPERRSLLFTIPNTANKQRIATELLVVSDNIDLPAEVQPVPNGEAIWVA